MKKILSIIIVSLLVVFSLTGCTSSKSYTYSVETGDLIEIELNTSDGYDITSTLPFSISKNNEILSEGIFITPDIYNEYIQVVNRDFNSKIINSGNKNGITYTFYSYNNCEFNYIIKIDNSNTGILLGNPNSQKEAEECFNRLNISVK